MLMVNNTECSDTKAISEEIYKFFSKLYSSSYSEEHSLLFLESIKQYIPQIETDFKERCDSVINMKELDLALKQMSIGKSPGEDGLTSNFYKFFWEEIKELLFSALKEF